jgi:hypothetical protein
VDLHVSWFGDEVVIGGRGHEMETVKLTIALVPVSLLLCGSVVLFRTTQSIWVSFQLLGSLFLGVVISAHVCEALGIFPWMRWGSEGSIGHHVDLGSALLGLTLFPLGYCLYALNVPTTESDPPLAREK